MKITNTNIYNLAESIVASGFPMRTDDVSSSWNEDVENVKEYLATINENYSLQAKLGKVHYDRAIKLGNSKIGSGHNCFLKGILVTANITGSKVFWSQWQRYHFSDIVSSMSFMHRLSKLNIDEDKFDRIIIERFKEMINEYNTKDWKSNDEKAKYFEYLVENAPSGIELTAHIVTNYLQLSSVVNQRSGHKMSFWQIHNEWANNLLCFKELCQTKLFL